MVCWDSKRVGKNLPEWLGKLIPLEVRDRSLITRRRLHNRLVGWLLGFNAVSTAMVISRREQSW